jgi:hypothetical protein
VKMRKKFDRIGIATVYRNLDKLVDDWELMKLTGVFDKTYYEKNKWPHAHLIDTERFAIVDVKLDPKSLNFPDGFVLKETQMHFVWSWEGNIPAEGISLLPESIDWTQKDQNDEKTKETDDNADIISFNEDVLDEDNNKKNENNSQSTKKDDNFSGHHKTFREF